MKSTLFKRILGMVLLTVFLCSLLTLFAFSYSGRSVFTKMKANELLPRAQYIASIAAQFMHGEIGIVTFQRLLGDSTAFDATLFVYNYKGALIASTVSQQSFLISSELKKYVPGVLMGNSMTLREESAGLGVIVGVPVYEADGDIIGAVFLNKPLHEVNAALSGLIGALIMSLIAVTAIMVVPVYIATRSITRPLKQMTGAARAMAEGDFTVRAEEKGALEVSQLGASLNFLSGALRDTISDLLLERNRLRSVIDGMSEGIIATDAFARVTQFNPASVRLLGANASGVLEELAVFPGIQKQIMTSILEKKPSSSELKINEAVLRVTVSPLFFRDSEVSGAVALIQDITKEQRLEQTRKDYVANVSHELRTPIASIRSLAEALNDGMVKSPEDRSRYYGYILRESMRLSRLINDLLELSRLQSGNVALEKQVMSVKDLLLDLSDRYSDIAGESGLKFVSELPHDMPDVFSNPDRVEQVLIAILDNAVKYSPDEGTILMGARQTGGKLQISISNEGSISEEEMPHLFERFYKLDKSRAGEGTGLGLSIAREIMELMHEQIFVTSKDGFITFSITLQTAADDALQKGFGCDKIL
ncbi:MAG: Sensor histidine kinase YycG [Firmicutes bacterium ADurb.Bin182]|nr:MAG: Sensor histidine kinase YycG [Firmicutes bacterium ADurb.Bin182]